MIEEGLYLAAVTARYAAGGLLLVAAVGKAFSAVGRTSTVRAVVLLVCAEFVAGCLLLLPVSGLPVWGASSLFGLFAGAQAIGRKAGQHRPCGCYGEAAPHAVYTYGAVVMFVVLAAGIAATTVMTPTVSEDVISVARIAGLVVALGMIALIRRNSRSVTALPPPSG